MLVVVQERVQVWIKEHAGNCSADVTEKKTGDCDTNSNEHK